MRSLRRHKSSPRTSGTSGSSGSTVSIGSTPTCPFRKSYPNVLVARVGNTASVRGEPGGTSGSIHGLGYLFSALRREGLIADELVLQLATFLRSLDLFLELTARTVPRTLTANQVQRGGKQGTDGPELSRIHSSTQHPRDKQRQASAPGADQQRLQHSRARQTYRSMLLLVLRCASRRCGFRKPQILAYRWCSPPRIGCAIMSPNRSIGRVQGASLPSER
jgi:hypothetical protein